VPYNNKKNIYAVIYTLNFYIQFLSNIYI